MEKSSPDYDKALAQSLALTPEWKEFAFTFTTPAYAPNTASVHFVVGQQAGTVEVPRVTLEDYGVNPQPRPADMGRDLYGGQPHDDSWRPAANAGGRTRPATRINPALTRCVRSSATTG